MKFAKPVTVIDALFIGRIEIIRLIRPTFNRILGVLTVNDTSSGIFHIAKILISIVLGTDTLDDVVREFCRYAFKDLRLTHKIKRTPRLTYMHTSSNGLPQSV